ncbi:MAG: RNA polymerase subunit sigma-24 [Burkholderiales bacterium PBB5]|nr:MAG: RNA polymerase subunit sigma-24 [Burkholderiales bacterium PBB5]
MAMPCPATTATEAASSAQDALLAALAHWPAHGVPDNPAAWLTTAAKRRALDHLRHHQVMAREHAALGADLDARQAAVVPDFVDALDAARADTIGDDPLRLMLIACHPVLPLDGRVALTLRLLGGLSTAEIARACLSTEATIAQRIVRAKKTLANAGVPFELPRGPALAERLGAVQEVVYLVFNEGYSASQGDDLMRPALCAEALRLGRLLAELAPDSPEALGLLALMELQASRSAARCDDQGEPVLLPAQDRSRWDGAQIQRGLSALAKAEALARHHQAGWGPYQLQAAIAACHSRAATAADTDWPRIARLYTALAHALPSPVVALNRAVAVGMADGPAAGLALLEDLAADPQLQRYPWLHSARADLLGRLGRYAEAGQAWLQAAALTGNRREQAWLTARAAACAETTNGAEAPLTEPGLPQQSLASPRGFEPL